MNRRGFLGLLSASAIVAVTPLKFVSAELHEKAVRELSLSEIINETIRKYALQIRANIEQNNALLARLQNR